MQFAVYKRSNNYVLDMIKIKQRLYKGQADWLIFKKNLVKTRKIVKF